MPFDQTLNINRSRHPNDVGRRHLKGVLDGVILQDTVHYFSLDMEQKILQCFTLDLTKGQRRGMCAEGVTKTRGASLYAGF